MQGSTARVQRRLSNVNMNNTLHISGDVQIKVRTFSWVALKNLIFLLSSYPETRTS